MGGEHTRPEAPQPPPPYPAACPGGPLTRGSLPPVPRLQQLPPGPGPPVRLVRPAGQVSGGRSRSTSRWARRPGRVPEVGCRAVAEFPHPALRAQPRIWWASPSPHCPACPLLLPPAPSGPGLRHLSQVSPGPLQLLSSPRSSQQPQESLTATLSQVHVLMHLAPSSLSRVPFTPTACCAPAGPSSQAPCRKSPREPESHTGTQRAPAPQVYPQGPMRAGSPAQPVAMELRGRPLPAHPEPAAGPPSPPGAGPGQMPAAACRHLPGRGLPRLPPLPLPPLPALPLPRRAVLSSHASQVTLSVPRLPTLTVDEYFHCAFGNYDSLAHVEGTHVACVTPPQDQLPHNPPGTGEGPPGRGARGEPEGQEPHGRPCHHHMPPRAHHLAPGPDVRGRGRGYRQLLLLRLRCRAGLGRGCPVSAGPSCWVGVVSPDGAPPERPPVPPGAVLVWAAAGGATGAPRAAAVCTGNAARRARGPSTVPNRWAGPACWLLFTSAVRPPYPGPA